MEERVTFLVHRVNARLAQACKPLFRRHALDLYSSRILVCLLERSEVGVGEMVEIIALPQSTISHQLLRLEKQGLIRRRRKTGDNRSVLLTLTAKGSPVARACNELSARIYGALTRSFSPDEIAVLRGLLRRMFAEIDASAEASAR